MLSLGAIGAVTLGIILFPRASALINQVQAGQFIQRVMAQEGIENVNTLFCRTSPLENAILDQSIAGLQKAMLYNPSLSQAALWLGRGYLLRGEPDKAVSAYLDFVKLKPENRLGHLEAGEAYMALLRTVMKGKLGDASSISTSQTSQDEALFKAIKKELLAAGTGQSQWIEIARDAFTRGSYDQTLCYYQVAYILDSNLMTGDEFLWSLAAILQNPLVDAGEIARVNKIYNLQNEVQVAAKDLQWAEPFRSLGQSLSDNPGANPALGIMWWNGVAVAVVRVSDPGNYVLTLRVREDAPAPIELSVENNFTQVADFSLNRADSSWQEVSAEINLNQGLNLIGIRYKNDAKVDGVDRNAVLDWIRLSR